MRPNTTPDDNAHKLGRRPVLKTAAAGGAASLAGCLSNLGTDQQTTDPEPTETMNNQNNSEEGLDPAKDVDTDRIAADPTELPDPVDWDEPRRHEIELTTTEETAEIEPGVTFDYMTFDGRIPGPMVRVRRGDTVNLTLTNPDENSMPHNIDFHAVYGPGGGAEDTTINPGESATIEFKAMYPGVHVYHCAVPNMDHHISAGMYGAILVEPEEGLPEVDRELYFGQNEIYTNGAPGEEGHHKFSYDNMRDEEPTYVCLNGSSGPTVARTSGARGTQSGTFGRRSTATARWPPSRTTTSRPHLSCLARSQRQRSTHRCQVRSNWSTTRSPAWLAKGCSASSRSTAKKSRKSSTRTRRIRRRTPLPPLGSG